MTHLFAKYFSNLISRYSAAHIPAAEPISGSFFRTLLPGKSIPSFLFLAVTGTLTHFLYEWTGSPFLALFCPINESVWEHLKLLYFPFLTLTLWTYPRQSLPARTYFHTRLYAVLYGMLSILVLYYTYTGIIGRNYLLPDILIFLASITLTLHLCHHPPKHLPHAPSLTTTYTLWLLLTLLFPLLTCYPPNLPLFLSP